MHCCCVHIVVPYWLLGSVRCCCGCIVVPYQVAWFRAFLLGATVIHQVDVPGVVLPHRVAQDCTCRFVPALSCVVIPRVAWPVFWVVTLSALLLVAVVCRYGCFLVVCGSCCKKIVGVAFSSEKRVGTLRLGQLFPPRLVSCSGCEQYAIGKGRIYKGYE